MQVSKQADVLMLLYLLPERFPPHVLSPNFDYYEARTLHDSSLSLAIHGILALRLGLPDLGYSFFRRACGIDFGPNLKSSDEGIHAAAMGGLWQLVTFGVAGLRPEPEALWIDPHLPETWSGLSLTFVYQGSRIGIQITRGRLTLRLLEGAPRRVRVGETDTLLESELQIVL